MKKKIEIIFIFILCLTLNSCGFKKINQRDKNVIYIQNITITGDNRISYKLKNDILLISNSKAKNKYDIEIVLKKKKNDKIKDIAGKITRYDLSISASLILKNLNDNKIVQKTFIRNRNYDISSNYSKTVAKEKSAIKIIVQQLTDDIKQFIKLSMRGK
jgi:hypothetical protein